MEISHNIHNLTAKQLDLVTERYPWFSYARELSILKMAAIDQAEAENALKKCQAYITRRKRIYNALIKGKTSSFSVEDIQMEFKSSDPTVESGNLPILSASSEYFSPMEVADASKSTESNLLEKAASKETTSCGVAEYQTETLAIIYEDQEYFSEALEVYAKLILLYPQKSAYFASCVERIQRKMVQKETNTSLK